MLHIYDNILCPACFTAVAEGADVCHACGYHDGDEIITESGVLVIGTVLLGKYAVGRVLGCGGFGVTYLGYDMRNEKRVAIKEYLPDGLAYRTGDSTTVASYSGEKSEHYKIGANEFYEEAKTISRFNGHPHIVNVYEFFHENNTAYFVMEYIDGVNLKTYIKNLGGKLSATESFALLTPIMDALTIVHSLGILHRDIAPDNIFIADNGLVKLLDFGAAKQILGEASKSLAVVLKEGFAPLEQYQRRGKQGPWTDVYALGGTIYYCLTGSAPEGATDRMMEGMSEISIAGASPAVNAVIKKAMALQPNERYVSTVELKTAFGEAVQSSQIPVTPMPQPAFTSQTPASQPIVQSPAQKPSKKLWKWFAIGTAGLVTVIMLAVGINFIVQKLTYEPYVPTGGGGGGGIGLSGTYESSTPTPTPVTSPSYEAEKVTVLLQWYDFEELFDAASDETKIIFETKIVGYSEIEDMFRVSLSVGEKFISLVSLDYLQNVNIPFEFIHKIPEFMPYCLVANLYEDELLDTIIGELVGQSQLPSVQFELAQARYYRYGIAVTGNTPLRAAIFTADWGFYANADDYFKLYKVDSDRQNRQKICDDEAAFINVSFDWVYYVNLSDNGRIYRIGHDGTGREAISNEVGCNSLYTLGDWIFYSCYGSNGTYEFYAGEEKTLLLNEVAHSIFTPNDGFMYYHDWTNIWSISLDENLNEREPKKLASGYSFGVYDEWMYFNNSDDNNCLWKMRVDGSDAEKLTDDIVACIIVFSNCVQYLNYDDEHVYQINFDGTGREFVR